MAISDVSLTASMRSVLLSLQDTEKKINRTSERLATGLKVNSALDNPTNYFAARAHTNRANDLSARKDGMTEAIQAIKAANEGIEGITTLIEQAKGLAQSARSESSTTSRAALASQFNAILSQITNLVEDADYKGTNFLQANSLEVKFNEAGDNTLTVTGFSADASSLGVTTASGSWSSDANIGSAETELAAALTTLRTNSTGFANSLAVVNARLDFTTNLSNVLIEGANNLTLADTNEEGANLLLLQTRQQLGSTSLSIASQSAQSVLRLF